MAIEEQQEIHDALVSLYARVNEQKFYFRKMEPSPLLKEIFKTSPQTAGIDRDRTICALMSKAATTFKAIRLLVTADLCDDAHALCRVLLENAVFLAWMTQGDWISRVDTYGLSHAVNRVRLAKATEEHHGDDEETKKVLSNFSKDLMLHTISKAVFNDKHLNWAVMSDPADSEKTKVYRIGEMLKEMDPSNVKPITGHYGYAISYFELSQSVHSLPLSLRGYEADLSALKTYRIREVNSRPRAAFVLAVANSWMLFCIGGLNDFLNAGLDDDIVTIREQLKRSQGPSDDEL